METVKILKPNTNEYEIMSSACTSNNLILNFDADTYNITDLLNDMREVTSLDLYDTIFPDRPFGEYHYLTFFNITEYSTSNTIEVRFTIIKGDEREALELLDKIESLEESQEDQDEAILDLAETVFSEEE